MTISETAFRLSPSWVLTGAHDSLIVHGGADARFEIELKDAESSFFARYTTDEPFGRAQLSPQDQLVLEQLITAEIVVPVLSKRAQLRVALVGDAAGFTLPAATGRLASNSVAVVDPAQPHDLQVVVRANSTFGALLEALDYPTLTTPHLLVDVAFHHNASIGPLVFPGETACLACLNGRISKRWGDDAPPPEPVASRALGDLVAQLTMHELSRVASGETTLTNKTFSWDFASRAVTKAQLLKVPLCPVCTTHHDNTSGSIHLPWSDDEGPAYAV